MRNKSAVDNSSETYACVNSNIAVPNCSCTSLVPIYSINFVTNSKSSDNDRDKSTSSPELHRTIPKQTMPLKDIRSIVSAYHATLEYEKLSDFKSVNDFCRFWSMDVEGNIATKHLKFNPCTNRYFNLYRSYKPYEEIEYDGNGGQYALYITRAFEGAYFGDSENVFWCPHTYMGKRQDKKKCSVFYNAITVEISYYDHEYSKDTILSEIINMEKSGYIPAPTMILDDRKKTLRILEALFSR